MLKKSQLSLQATLDSSLYVIQAFKAVRNKSGKIVDFVWVMNNKKAIEQNGDVIGKSLLQQNPGVVKSGLFKKFIQVTETGIELDQEVYYNHEQFNGWFHQMLVKMGDGFVMHTEDITKKKKNELELLHLKDEMVQQVKDKYQLLFNTIDEGVCVVELELNKRGKINNIYFREVNESFAKQSGFSNAVGKSIKELLPNFEKYWIDIFSEVMRTGESVRVENYVQDVGRWYTAYFSLVGRVGSKYISVVFNDITEHKKSEEALRKSQQLLAEELEDTKHLQEISSSLIEVDNVDQMYDKILDILKTIMHSDMASLQIFVPEKNALHLLDWKGFHPNSAKLWEWVEAGSGSVCGIALATNKRIIVTDVEDWNVIKNARDLKPFRLSKIRSIQSTPLISRSGKTIGMLSTYWKNIYISTERELHLLDIVARQTADLIERNNAEEILKKSEENDRRLATLTNSMMDAVISTDTRFRIMTWNKGAEEIYQWKKSEVIGRTFRSVLASTFDSPTTRKSSIKELKKNNVWKGELLQRRKDGKKVAVLSTVAIVKDEKKKIIGYVAVNHDISRRKKLERQKDEFIGIASHELKTPVTSIKTFTEVLEKRFYKKGDKTNAALLGKMKRQINKLSVLVNDLLDITKIESEKFQLYKVYFDFDTLVYETIEEVQRITQKHKIIKEGTIRKKFLGDKERLGQVITNLLTNAIKYSPKTKDIILGISSNKKEIVISVQDFGVGIAETKQQKIFERFYRESGAKEFTFPGLGVGLYIASEIIRKHDGKIWVESKKGKGAKFFFSLPIRRS